jgi:hypothetical protein
VKNITLVICEDEFIFDVMEATLRARLMISHRRREEAGQTSIVDWS